MKLSNALLLSTIHLDACLSPVDAAPKKCGTWATERCIGEIDKRYDPNNSPNLADLHPLYGKMDGYWLGTYTSYEPTTKTPWVAKYPTMYEIKKVPYYLNISVSGTRFHEHHAIFMSKAAQSFCESPNQPYYTFPLDNGICGVNGWVRLADLYRASTHELNDVSVTVKGTGYLSECEPGLCGGTGKPVEDNVFYAGDFQVAEDNPTSFHHVKLYFFASDYNSFFMEKAIYTETNQVFDQFSEGEGNFERISESEFIAGIEEAMNTYNLTKTYRDGILNKLPLQAGECFLGPCPTEDDWARVDPNLSESPYQEQYKVKTGVVAGFTIMAAVLLIAGIIAFYQWRINKLKEAAKHKFARRMSQSTKKLVSGNDSSGVTPKDLIDTFNRIDCGEEDGGNGLISKDELWAYISDMKDGSVVKKESVMTQKEFDVLFESIDKDHSHQIDFAEFCAFIAEVNRP